jgi:hypothetical protein
VGFSAIARTLILVGVTAWASASCSTAPSAGESNLVEGSTVPPSAAYALELLDALAMHQDANGCWQPESTALAPAESSSQCYDGLAVAGINGLALLSYVRGLPLAQGSQRQHFMKVADRCADWFLQCQDLESGIFEYDFRDYSQFSSQCFAVAGLAEWSVHQPSPELRAAIVLASQRLCRPHQGRSFSEGLLLGGVANSLERAGLEVGAMDALLNSQAIRLVQPSKGGQRNPYSPKSKYPDHPICIALMDVEDFCDFDNGDSPSVLAASAMLRRGVQVSEEQIAWALSGTANGDLPPTSRDLLCCALNAVYLVPQLPPDHPQVQAWAKRMEREVLTHPQWQPKSELKGLVPYAGIYGQDLGAVGCTSLIALIATTVSSIQ